MGSDKKWPGYICVRHTLWTCYGDGSWNILKENLQAGWDLPMEEDLQAVWDLPLEEDLQVLWDLPLEEDMVVVAVGRASVLGRTVFNESRCILACFCRESVVLGHMEPMPI